MGSSARSNKKTNGVLNSLSFQANKCNEFQMRIFLLLNIVSFFEQRHQLRQLNYPKKLAQQDILSHTSCCWHQTLCCNVRNGSMRMWWVGFRRRVHLSKQ